MKSGMQSFKRQNMGADALSWVPQIANGSGPKYLAIAEALLSDIQEGRLRPGHRLPPQRLLAKELGVDLTTVTRAFNEARRMGLIEANTGRGSFVRRLPEQDGFAPTASPIIDLSMNLPPQPPEAKLRERIQKGIADVLTSPDGLLHLHYQESAGTRSDRAAGAHWLERRLGPLQVDRVMVVGGAQTALYAILRSLLQPGDALCVPFLTYPGLKAIAGQLGLRLAPVAMDAEGPDAAAFEEVCQREKPRAFYCVPTVHNPTTATMSLKRRHEIAELARRYKVSIVEDDAYGALPSQAPTPIVALAPDITWHIATLSKCVTPALRTAYVVTPALTETLRLAVEIRTVALMTSPLLAALASRWILDGTLDAITMAIREESAARQALAQRILNGQKFMAHPEGHHIWLTLPQQWRQSDLNSYARGSGLALVPSDAFAVGPAPDAIRVSLGAAQNRNVLERGLGVLAAVLSHGPRSLSSIV